MTINLAAVSIFSSVRLCTGRMVVWDSGTRFIAYEYFGVYVCWVVSLVVLLLWGGFIGIYIVAVEACVEGLDKPQNTHML